MLGETNSSAKTVTLPMKLRFSFGFSVLYGLRVFPNLVFVFGSVVTTNGGFSDFSVQCRYDFSGVTEDVIPCSRAKTVIPETANERNALQA